MDEDELLPPPPKKKVSGDDGLLPPPPLKKYTPFIFWTKVYWERFVYWLTKPI